MLNTKLRWNQVKKEVKNEKRRPNKEGGEKGKSRKLFRVHLRLVQVLGKVFSFDFNKFRWKVDKLSWNFQVVFKVCYGWIKVFKKWVWIGTIGLYIVLIPMKL